MNTKHFTHPAMLLFALVVCLAGGPTALAQGTTAFTYQGQLRDGSTNANGTYSLTFKLYDAVGGGNQVGPTVTAASQFITNGLFSAPLDFGSVFDGSARWLEINVAGNVLTPRTPITPAPYALFAAKAGSVQNPTFLGTTGNTPLELFVNNTRVVRLEPTSGAPNIVAGYSGNYVTPGKSSATIAGGGTPLDSFTGTMATNKVLDNAGTIGGGIGNTAGNGSGAVGATVAGGYRNTASGMAAVVGGGSFNTASGISSTVAGGDNNKAQGDVSFAAGTFANAAHNGAFVWSDSAGTNDFSSTAINQFSVRAGGGVRFFTGYDGNGNGNAGLRLNATGNGASIFDVGGQVSFQGGAITASGTVTAQGFNPPSDRNLKEKFTPINSREVLERVARLPISNWNFKTDGQTRHIGPMAQDFYAAFGVGTDDRHIATVDADGVALAAIQGLNQVVKEKDVEIAALRKRLEDLEQAVASLVQKQNGGRR